MARACTTSQYFTLGTAAALQITGDITVLSWALGTGVNFGHLMQCYNHAASPFNGYGLRIDGAGKLNYWNNAVAAWQVSTNAINSGTWRAIGITTSGTGAGAGTFWADGAANGTWTHSAPAAHTGNKAIGATEVGGTILGYTLAEMAVWNVALTAGEIAAYALGELPFRIRQGSLVAYWPFWGLHDPEIDLGPNKYPATLVAAPTLANHAPVGLLSGSFWSIPLSEPGVPAYSHAAYRFRADDGALIAP